MYCIQCGVKLSDTEKTCPLCGTVVYHPQLERAKAEPLYPRDKMPPQRPMSRMLHILVTAAVLLPLLLVLLADLQTSGTVTWSIHVIGAILVGYVWIILPLWFRNPNPVIFVPCGFAAVIAYLFYLSWATGGSWFLTFALPVAGGVALVVSAMTALLRYVKKGVLYIVGGGVIAMGALTLMCELLMDLTFGLPRFIGWSLYPLVTLTILGGVLIFLAICRSARLVMERKFFI